MQDDVFGAKESTLELSDPMLEFLFRAPPVDDDPAEDEHRILLDDFVETVVAGFFEEEDLRHWWRHPALPLTRSHHLIWIGRLSGERRCL
ncbi:MAG: hypothetical protein M1325_06715 [Actinobacteria bacterium]|nr:hypothetical protein [Actinomycetota bacterium]